MTELNHSDLTVVFSRPKSFAIASFTTADKLGIVLFLGSAIALFASKVRVFISFTTADKLGIALFFWSAITLFFG
ncbi:hypothetical protein [Nostoc sp.]|uniref:hypothetical protein n=1 Tax=Nostoc sp. TaxID=1180 RepID=UPI002FFB036D